MCKGKAMIIAWPETTARGDEKWYSVLKRLKIVKNVNFKVGHAAIILIDDVSGSLFYYDFGRYITPRGKGRTRSAESDPKLTILTKAIIIDDQISNILEICSELADKKKDTHGDGPMYFSIADSFNFQMAKKEADNMVRTGSIPYGAMASGNSNCSRFVWQVYKAGRKPNVNGIFYSLHATIMPSPITNVVNASADEFIYKHYHKLEQIKMDRMQSLYFFLQQLSQNFYSKKAQLLPSDKLNGNYFDIKKPAHLPENSVLLVGLGENAWYTYQLSKVESTLHIIRYDSNGMKEYEHHYTLNAETLSELSSESIKLTYDSHCLHSTFVVKDRKIKLYPSSKVIHEKHQIPLLTESF